MTLNLAEPLVTATVTLLKNNLNGQIDTVNASVTDGYTVPHAVQFLPFVPVPSTLEGGMPAIGIQRLPARFEDDLRVAGMHSVQQWAIVAILQHTDQLTLSWQLDRMMQAIANTIQADRVAGTPPGTASTLKIAGAWAVDFINTEPGPLLGDLDPTDPEAPPRSYLSWTALVLEAKKVEL